jgi:hypothetical protein
MKTVLKMTTLVAIPLLLAVTTAAQAGQTRAGAVGFLAGQAGIYIPLDPPVPQKYSVVVQATNTAGYSPTSECTYFNVLKEKPHEFQVQHKTCKDGTPIPLDTNVTLKWVLITR